MEFFSNHMVLSYVLNICLVAFVEDIRKISASDEVCYIDCRIRSSEMNIPGSGIEIRSGVLNVGDSLRNIILWFRNVHTYSR